MAQRQWRLAAQAATLAATLAAAMAAMMVCGVATAEDAGSPPAWPFPADIPNPAPVAVGLAGSATPDLVRYFTARGPLGGSLSPDGGTIAYRDEVTGVAQLWAIDVDGGMPRQLTFAPGGVSSIGWTPDNQIMVAADSNGDEREGYTILSRDGRSEREVRARSEAFVSFGDFSADGARFVYASTQRNGDDFDVFVGATDGSGSKSVFQGRFGNFPQSWRPGTPEVIVAETRGEDAQDIFLLNVDTGKRRYLFKPRIAAAYEGFAWAPDGKSFYLSTNEGREFAALARYDLDRGRLTVLDAPPGDVEQVRLFGEGRYLAWSVNDGGYSRLHVLDLSTGKELTLPDLPLGVYGLSGAEKSPRLLVRIEGPKTPGEFWIVDASTASARKVVGSDPAGLALERFVAPESLTFAARDGVTLQGLFYAPPGVSGKAPVVVMVHGGPTGQARPYFEPFVQFLLARGVAVFDLNFRGSTGFGKSFARLDNGRLRPNAVRDIEDAVRFLATKPQVDVSRAAVMGGSYGGYLTNAVLGEYPDVFKAGVSFVGVSDWVHALENASPALKASDRIEYGDITDPKWREFFAELSPIRRADRIKAALFVAHGANDPRDPVVESDRLVTAVRANGAQVVYMRFADEGHGIRRLANRIHAYRGIADFLDRTLAPPPAK